MRDRIEYPQKFNKKYKEVEIKRTFCLIDIVGFTAYEEHYGTSSSLELIKVFRDIVRRVSTSRGVLVFKWLGDAVILSGDSETKCVLATVEIAEELLQKTISFRIGISTGNVLMIDGDDFIGKPINVASRLCDEAGVNEILANVKKRNIVDGISIIGKRNIKVDGLEKELRSIFVLSVETILDKGA